uniref:Uncharacterized protein n=1 Tax=Liagora harveyana TaxID=406718 RepID=A0A1G4NV01_9FLOR|nr:Hypothetical protein ORF_7 [Liagora harveyana]SCW22521.1 Hypothetical protein ORF_7 [Liagora harveyana]
MIPINSSFIKTWDCTVNPKSLSQIRHNKSIPPYIRILATNNGSFTRNNSILQNQLINIILIQQCQETYRTNQRYHHINKLNQYKRQVWLINNESKKKFYLQNLTCMTVF